MIFLLVEKIEAKREVNVIISSSAKREKERESPGC